MSQRRQDSSFRTHPTTATMTVTSTSSSSSNDASHTNVARLGTLRLRGFADVASRPEPDRRVQWAEDVVNNEGMGKKKSKVCCIYHGPRTVGESSDEDSSSDSSDSSDDDDAGSSSKDDGAARSSKPAAHQHGDHNCNRHSSSKMKKRPRANSPNAYEKQPKPQSRKPVDV